MPPRSPAGKPKYSPNASATYLANLRNNRPARPGGARPLPGKPDFAENRLTQTTIENDSKISLSKEECEHDGHKAYSMHPSGSLGSLKGRPLVPAPQSSASQKDTSSNSMLPRRPGEIRYRESTTRELERQEAHSIREALESIDYADEETRIHAAAQKEAADLVWKHLNPRLAEQEKTAAYRNPDLTQNRTSVVLSKNTTDNALKRVKPNRFTAEDSDEIDECKAEVLRVSKRESANLVDGHQTLATSNNRRRSSGKRNVSSDSNKGAFRTSEVQIYEEPEEVEAQPTKQKIGEILPLQSRHRNSLPRGSRPLPEKQQSVPLPERPKHDRFEIHRNLPSQSRKADYTANSPASREETPEFETPKGRAMEIRSDEIRAATSMKRKDRSPKLPTPTAVSDRLGRPIVSFDPGWRPGTESPKTSLDIQRPLPKQPTPVTTQSAPVVPTINLPANDIPVINFPADEPPVPSISISADPEAPGIDLPGKSASVKQPVPSINLTKNASTRPLPQIDVHGDSTIRSRPLPFKTQSSPAKLPLSDSIRTKRVPWLSRGPQTNPGSTINCNACQLPISGRIVTASGAAQHGPKARFHPECFSCFHCSTALECVSFYPEPELAREERLQHEDDGDPSELRFFCHLDYHDLFSPRCANCKTPIEGAVVIAAGKSWHEGHFFCAECGDPFSSTSPFVEDKGYAYCVGCHTKRTSARCRACKKQILDEVSIEALGGKWHEECFCCDECGADFGEDGRFFVREVEIELTEKEKRKGLFSKKFEDRAVCQRCETLRLRRVDVFL